MWLGLYMSWGQQRQTNTKTKYKRENERRIIRSDQNRLFLFLFEFVCCLIFIWEFKTKKNLNICWNVRTYFCNFLALSSFSVSLYRDRSHTLWYVAVSFGCLPCRTYAFRLWFVGRMTCDTEKCVSNGDNSSNSGFYDLDLKKKICFCCLDFTLIRLECLERVCLLFFFGWMFICFVSWAFMSH